MRRTLAFLVAPLLVPILLYQWIRDLMGSPAWIKFGLVIATTFSYGGVLVLGVPLLTYLWKRERTGLWVTCVSGLLLGIMSWVVFAVIFFPAMLGQGFQGIQDALNNPNLLSSVFWPGGLSGAVVGIAIW